MSVCEPITDEEWKALMPYLNKRTIKPKSVLVYGVGIGIYLEEIGEEEQWN